MKHVYFLIFGFLIFLSTPFSVIASMTPLCFETGNEIIIFSTPLYDSSGVPPYLENDEQFYIIYGPDGNEVDTWIAANQNQGVTWNDKEFAILPNTNYNGTYHFLRYQKWQSEGVPFPQPPSTYPEALTGLGYLNEQHAVTVGNCSNINASIASFSLIDNPKAGEMIASVASGVKDTASNIWVIIAAIIALYICFYVLKKVIDLYPSPETARYEKDIL